MGRVRFFGCTYKRKIDFVAVVIKNPSDFIGSALGESEKNTKAILANTVGKVLIIDEVGKEFICD
jgi:hypothetical protein